MTHYIVRARSDGRAGMPMFGLSTKQAKSFAGQKVHIGDRNALMSLRYRWGCPSTDARILRLIELYEEPVYV